MAAVVIASGVDAVSYTHLDVYKRQVVGGAIMEDFPLFLLNFCKDACELLCFRLDCEFLFFNTPNDKLEEDAFVFKDVSIDDTVSLLSE